ncbi:hypothetical protein ACOSQ2_019982 [Xanthoceras sorbifolium]
MEESLLQPLPPPTSILERPEEEEEKVNNFPPTTRDVLFTEVKRLDCSQAGPMVALTLSQYLLQVISLMMVGHLSELALSGAAITISLSGVTGFSLLLGMASSFETLCGQAYGAQQYRKIGTQTYTAIFSLFLPLIRYFQTQSLTFPMFLSSCVTLCLHIPLCWGLVFKSGLGNIGVALTISGIGEFFKFAIPSAVMICLDTIETLFTVTYGLGVAVSIQQIRSREPNMAHVAVYVVMLLAATEAIIVSLTLFAIVDYVTTFAPQVCMSVILDGLKESFQVKIYSNCVARGYGWQHIGAFVNLQAFYLCGIPIAVSLGFRLKLRGTGFWIGVLAGAFTQTVLLSIITSKCPSKEKNKKKIIKNQIFEPR